MSELFYGPTAPMVWLRITIILWSVTFLFFLFFLPSLFVWSNFGGMLLFYLGDCALPASQGRGGVELSQTRGKEKASAFRKLIRALRVVKLNTHQTSSQIHAAYTGFPREEHTRVEIRGFYK